MLTKRTCPEGVLFTCVFAIAVLLCASCSEDKKSPVSPDASETNAYLAALPSWEEFANVQDTATQPAGDKIVEMSRQVACTTTPYNITQNPDEIITFGSAPDILYLGSLIQGDSYLSGLGSMEELPIRQRAPLTIAIKLFTGTDITAVVGNPDAASVQSALNTLVADAAANGQKSGSRISYNYKESYSAMQAALSLGVSFKYMTAAGRVALDFQVSEESHTVTALFKQIMFEAYIVRPQTPGQFFSSSFTKALLDEQIALGNIGPDNLPVYVSRIQYGRMLMYSMTYEGSSMALKAAVGASYNGVASVDGEIRAEVEQILQNSEIKVATVGGDPASVLSLLRSGQLRDYFTTNDPITTAEPLAYALCNLADGSLARVSEMTSYSVTECSGVAAVAYTNKTEWQMAIEEFVGEGHVIEFLTTAENIALSDEHPTVPSPNAQMGPNLTWDSSSTHFPFTFRLRALQPGQYTGLVFDDQEPAGPAWSGLDQERSIGIGDMQDQEDDDFEIAIPAWHNKSAVFAIGMSVGSNQPEQGEGTTVYGVNEYSAVLDNSVPDCFGRIGFLGVVATVPLKAIEFNEYEGDNDIFVRDFCFGVLEWSE